LKWFKHISDSLDDPFIFDLLDRFGGDGYLVFFGVLEIYAREFKPTPNWNLSITRAYLKQKLHKRQDTLIMKSLEFIKNSGKWDININGSQITIFIPKFNELTDDWTKKKLRSDSVVAPKNLPLDKDKDKEEDISSKEDTLKSTSDEKLSLASMPKIKDEIEKIAERLYRKKAFPRVHAFKNQMLKQKINPRAILHSLIRCDLKKPEPSEAWGYCLNIIKVEDGNYNETDFNKAEERHNQ